MVNDVLKSLESCGSFIVVDEELLTVHFAHSSVKRHLLSEPTELDVRDYHIDSFRANNNLGKIAVTYLSLDVFGKQLIKTSGPSQPYAANVPSFVAKSALPKHEVVNRMALVILRGRKTPGNDSGLGLERSANLLREKTPMPEVFSFLPYCQEYWLYHTKAIHDSESDRVYELWKRLVKGTVGTVELPWALEEQTGLDEHFVSWIVRNNHTALIINTMQSLLFKLSDQSAIATRNDARLLEQMLSLLPNEDVRRNFVFISAERKDILLQGAAHYGHEVIVRLVLQQGVDVNAQSDRFGNALYAAVSNRNKRIAELLIKSGADVNLQDGRYGFVLQAAVRKFISVPIIELLLEQGADVNAYDEEYGTALIGAVRFNNWTAIELLLKAGADVNAHSEKYGNALQAAVENDYPDAVTVLLEVGAYVDQSPALAAGPLRLAAGLGRVDVVKVLLDYGADVDETPDSEKRYMKSYKTTTEIAQLLFSAGEKQRKMKLKSAQPF